MPDSYTYDQVADRIADELGIRPTTSTLRAGFSATGDGRTTGRVRITAGMPAPRPLLVNRRVVFDAAAIEAWLANHPHRALNRAVAALEQAPAGRLDAAVASARAAGLSWAQVAAALTTSTGMSRTRQWAQWRFGTSGQSRPPG
ncbi:hypothetical protein [Klenkia sp. PcliD-1-E]|uniref:hypothetical protein n=1 Tax=Klenkia sp. PcliD-1-E TaxID=2954492 RepID=UPI002096BDCD|nr:hypothetical protein [Klenkia sp. PcliD-1-E]MCO7221542.1 hypothetical protein [Klenkia sp. PcliD-1-E]